MQVRIPASISRDSPKCLQYIATHALGKLGFHKKNFVDRVVLKQ